MLKFRSMLPARGGHWLCIARHGARRVEGEDRRTRVGAFMRRTSIDELPQLWNVLKGEMSLVGPRPERPEYVEVFSGTSTATASGTVSSRASPAGLRCGLRGRTSLADRVEWDNYYIENWSLWLDFKIMLLTLAAVVRSAE